MLNQRLVHENNFSLENETSNESLVDSANGTMNVNTKGLINSQLNDEQLSSENEGSSLEFYNVDLNSDRPIELIDESCDEKLSYAWKIGGITGTFISTMAYCTGYIVERDLASGYSAKYYTVPYAASLIAPTVIGGISYLLSKHPHFKAGSASFIISGVITGAIDSLALLSFPDVPYAPASIVIPTLTAMTLINVVSPEVCLYLPTVPNKIAKLSHNCFSLFKSKLENAPPQGQVETNVSVDEKSHLIETRKPYSPMG